MGGTSFENIEILIASQLPNLSDENNPGDTPASSRSIYDPPETVTATITTSHDEDGAPRRRGRPQLQDHLSSTEDHEESVQPRDVNSTYATDHEDIDRKYRCVTIKKLPSTVSLAELLTHVHGGIVFNAYIRQPFRWAYVSFVDPQAAEDFIVF